MLVSPAQRDLKDFHLRLLANPGSYIAQNTLALSPAPRLWKKVWPRAISTCGPSPCSVKRDKAGARWADARGANGRLTGRELPRKGWHKRHLGHGGGRIMLSRTASELWMARYRSGRELARVSA